MRCREILVWLALMLTVRAAAAQSGPINLDFAQGKIGQVPAGWFVPRLSQAAGYSAKITTDPAAAGRRCALLRHDNTTAFRDPRAFGNLMQNFDAAPYRGKRVRFRATVRTEGFSPADRAQLWLRVDRPGGQMGFFDNMGDRPITSAQGQTCDIVGDVDADAERINLGLVLFGVGKAWLSDVLFTVVGKAGGDLEPPRPLTARGLANLVAYTRLLGYVRHFHPSDQAAGVEWGAFAIYGVRRMESAPDAAALARRLEALFHPIAPTVRVFPTGHAPPLPPALLPPVHAAGLHVVAWRHYGFGTGNPQSIYHSERLREPASGGKDPISLPVPQNAYLANLGGGVSCRVPLSLYADAGGTLPHIPPPPPLPAILPSGNDRATRLADVALAWNVFQHFYPYFDVVQTDWSQALREALTGAATDPDEIAFLKTLRRMVAALHDGHGNVYSPRDPATYALPIRWRWIEGYLVIVRVPPEGPSELRPGDLILKLDGKSADAAVAEAEALVSAATPQWRRFRAVENLELGPHSAPLMLEVQRPSGRHFSLTLRHTIPLEQFTQDRDFAERRPQPLTEIRPGIYYLDLSRITSADLLPALPKLAAAHGLICNLRGYPTEDALALLGHLTEKPITSAQWGVPIIARPDHQQWQFDLSRWDPIPPAEPRIRGKVAFLTDGRAISYAESYLGIVEYYHLGEIVGGPTAGTNGNINPFMLPGGYRIVWTGMRVLKHDGSRHHGVGIQPTVPCAPTIRGVVEGRDEVLERAIEIVEQ